MVPGITGAVGARTGAVGAVGQAVTSGVVKIRGLPYRTTTMDLAEFFQGFSFHMDTIRIGTGSACFALLLSRLISCTLPCSTLPCSTLPCSTLLYPTLP